VKPIVTLLHALGESFPILRVLANIRKFAMFEDVGKFLAPFDAMSDGR